VFLILFIAVIAMPAAGCAEDTVLLSTCVDDSAFCAETSVSRTDPSCGVSFYYRRGRMTWGPFRNRGPISVAVFTRTTFSSPLPLFVEIVQYPVNDPDSTCSTTLSGRLLFEAQGAIQCGVWETFGPLDLGVIVPAGERYAVAVEGIESPPDPRGDIVFHSVWFRCIRVTMSSTNVRSMSWWQVKRLYK
jgi:hypothetical protein